LTRSNISADQKKKTAVGKYTLLRWILTKRISF